MALAACAMPPSRSTPDPARVVWDYHVRAVGRPVELLEVEARLIAKLSREKDEVLTVSV